MLSIVTNQFLNIIKISGSQICQARSVTGCRMFNCMASEHVNTFEKSIINMAQQLDEEEVQEENSAFEEEFQNTLD